MIDSKTKLIGLIGYPSRHSLSPFIQNSFISENKKNAAYMVFEFSPENLIRAFEGMKALGFMGFNVTMPYKKKVFEMVDSADDTSRATKSVNTVKILPDSSCMGFNTDADGFMQAAEGKGYLWAGKALVIGAGGAARSTIYGLLKKKVNKIYIYNRSLKKAKNIKTLFEINDRIEIIKDLNDLKEEDTNFIINCTPIGMAIDEKLKNLLPVPEHWDLKDKFIMDMVYKPVTTPFIKKALAQGAKVVNGLDMLVSQAAFSFKIWFDMDNLPRTQAAEAGIQRLLERGMHGS